MLKKVLIVLGLWMSFNAVLAQDKKNQWIDSVFQTLNTAEKIGQLFVVPVSAYASTREIEALIDEMKDNHPGGVIISAGGPVGTAHLINQLQNQSAIPLLVMMDAERGPGKTLDSLITFPNPLSIGSIANDSLVFELGAEIARQLKTLGVNMNLAPNADINILASHPEHYYGSDKKLVTAKTIALMKGLQKGGVIAAAHHPYLPIDNDDHLDEDFSIDFINNRLDTVNFYPFDQLMKAGIGAINTSNLHFSTLDKNKPIPASVSRLFVSDILKKQLSFKGLTITEIPYFHRISGKSKIESEKLAFEVGNDLLIDPFNMDAAIRRIQTLLKRNDALQFQLDNSVKRILAAKYDVGLSILHLTNTDNIIHHINSPKAEVLRSQLTEAAITIVGNQSKLIPIKLLDGKKFASLSMGNGNKSIFETYLNYYAKVDLFSVEQATDTLLLEDKLKDYDKIFISFYKLNPTEKNSLINWLNQYIKNSEVIVCSFGNPYDLMGLHSPAALMIAYDDEPTTVQLMAQTIFGTRKSTGIAPLTIVNLFERGNGQPNETLNRLGYGIPEEVGMDATTLERIDAVVQQALDSGAAPGCDIVVARNGKIVFNKAYGWKTYDRADPVTPETIYDLASITKVAATLQTVMFMHEKKLIDINKKISVYLPELKQTNKKDFIIKDILTHQAGLWPYLPYWLQTMKDSMLLPNYYSKNQSADYPFPVSKDLFAAKSMKDSLWQWIIKAKIRDKKPKTPYDYTYSDMGFYMLQHLAEKLLNQPIEDFLAQNLYEPIGATTTGFLPLNRFPENRIAPTEVDKQFRGSKLTGYVHDQGAAMHGGVAGHAGLFSSANDLAKLGQMWLQKGSYGGQQFYKPETLEYFIHKQYETSRRGLGWDKPTISDWNGPTSLYASPMTFGHTGFTGTAIWVDPEFNLVFVFLSNRVYPDMFNTKLLTANIRPRIQDIIYQSIFEYCKGQN